MWLSSIFKKILIFFIKTYSLFSPFFYKGVCRFHPTCSQYATDAIKEYGILKGICKSLGRITRCNPFCKHGYDPIKKKGLNIR